MTEKLVIVSDRSSVIEAAEASELRYPVVTHRLNPAGDDSEVRATERLVFWSMVIPQILTSLLDDECYVAIEDYAFAASHGAHQIGEVGGLLRSELGRMGWVKWRKYSPTQIKKYAAHNGAAKKDVMVEAVQLRWGEDFTFLRPGKTKIWESAEDACDAYAIARLLHTELRLRAGDLELKHLPEAEREVFLSVSKKGETNLLAMPFIQRPKHGG